MDFKNEPTTDFSGSCRPAMESALAEARKAFGRTYPLIIDGKAVRARKTMRSINPSHPEEVVGIVQNADASLAGRALGAAVRAFDSWKRVSQEERARLLKRMAGALRRRKFDFCAWLIYEVGKSWAEADADVAEAIDFLEYYAERSLLGPPELTPALSEKNESIDRPLGPVVVIAPWNFPLAILVGMTSAAVVTGNTVVLKPSSQSPVIAARFLELAESAGLPAGVINLVTGSGSAIGDGLVKDSRTRMIAFTGSKAVGLRINALAARAAPAQRWLKRVIAELGGKNAIIVDESADLDAAVQGVLVSAFGYQGQKCSACSRAYIHRSLYGAFVERLVEKTARLRLGPAEVPENFMGPMISRPALETVRRYVALGRKEGRLLTGAPAAAPGGGFYAPATIFDRLAKNSRLWRDEIFGPVLALGEIRDFEEGLCQANATSYGLTGSVYSREPAHLARSREEFFCGNLYFNRKCTGALVGAHPFGGFELSGTDSKAGGPEYLSLFRQVQCVSEKY